MSRYVSFHFVEVVQIIDKVNLLFLFQIVLIYMTTQNVVNLNQSYFPMYLTETLHFEKVNNFRSFLCVRFPRVCAVSGRDLT